MNETRIFADAYQTTFADPKEMLEFLAQRAKESSWIRKPTRTLRLVPAIQEAGKMKDTVGKNWEEILEDTENNTQLALKIKTCNYNASKKWDDDAIPDNYVLQVKHYLSVMNMQKAYIACLYGNNEDEFVFRYVGFSSAFILNRNRKEQNE